METVCSAAMVFIGSNAQTLAPFGSATCNDLPTVLCRHPGTETVRSLALENTGLKGSFHVDCPVITCVFRIITARALTRSKPLVRRRDSSQFDGAVQCLIEDQDHGVITDIGFRF